MDKEITDYEVEGASLTEEEIDCLISYWKSIGSERGGLTDEEFQRDRALAVRRLAYWHYKTSGIFEAGDVPLHVQLAQEWGVPFTV